MTQYEEIMELLPSQFRDKPKLNAILKAASTQIEEMIEMFEAVDALTIDTATGKNLDMIGDIVNLSRMDTFALLNNSNIEITDDIYRRCLKFKIVYNNTDATYSDIMKGLKLLWPDVDVEYSETPAEPATIKIRLNGVDLDDPDPAATAPFIISPDGVQVILTNSFSHHTDTVDLESFGNEMLVYDSFVLHDGVYSFDGSRVFGPITTTANL